MGDLLKTESFARSVDRAGAHDRGREVADLDRAYHDAIADRYDSWYLEPWHYQRLHRELADDVRARVAVTDGLLVELAAGTGAIAIQLHRAGYRPVALDASSAMLRRAVAKEPGLRVVQADISTPLPLNDESAAAVLISQALHHVHDQAAVIRAAARLLPSGGVLFVFEPQLLPPALDFVRRLARRVCSTGEHVETEKPVDPEALVGLLERNGFEVESRRTTFFFPFSPASTVGQRIVDALWGLPARLPFVSRLGGVVKIVARRRG